MDVTAQKNAEERLRRERVRIKTLEGDVFEAYSFNVTRNTQIDLQTADAALMITPVRDEVVRQALAVAPPIGDPDSETRQVMLMAVPPPQRAMSSPLFIADWRINFPSES